MAAQEGTGGSSQQEQETLVDLVSRDPDRKVLIGFLETADQRSGWLRLYCNPDLTEYVEIGESDVLDQQTLAAEQSAPGGTVVWVKGNASVEYTRMSSEQAQVEYLTGDILGGWRGGTGDEEYSTLITALAAIPRAEFADMALGLVTRPTNVRTCRCLMIVEPEPELENRARER